MYVRPFPLTTWKVLAVTNTADVKAGWDYVESVCTCVSLESLIGKTVFINNLQVHTVPETRPKMMQHLKNCCINANEEHVKEKPSFSLKLNKFCGRFGPDQTGHGLRV